MAGVPYSSLRKNTPKDRGFRIVRIGLNREREELYARIDRRVDLMLEEGLEDEARRLWPLRHLNALNTVGYKELFDYFEGKTDYAEAVRLIKRNTGGMPANNCPGSGAMTISVGFIPTITRVS